MSFYALFPFLLPRLRSRNQWLLVFLLSLGLYAVNKLLGPHVYDYPEPQRYLVRDFTSLNLLSQLPVFMFGILAYELCKGPKPQLRTVAACALALAILLAAYSIPRLRIPHHLLAGAIFGMASVLVSRWPVRLCVNPWTVALGKISFSMYLVHFGIVALLASLGVGHALQEPNFASVLFYLSVLALSALVATQTRRYVEIPGIEAGKAWIEWIEQRTRSAGAGLPKARSRQ